MRVIAINGVDGDTDAGCGEKLPAADLERLPEGFKDTLSHCREAGIMVGVGLDDDELVTTKSGKGVTFANELLEPLCHRSQHQITHGMALGVVDQFEAVEIKEKDTDLPVFTASLRHGLEYAVVHQGPVWQPRQRVEVSQALNPLFGCTMIAQVGEHGIAFTDNPGLVFLCDFRQ